METATYDSKEKVYELLTKHEVAVLSTVSADNIPSAAAIYFVPDKELNFYFITKSDTEKSHNIESISHKAAITVIDPKILVEVQAKGEVNEIEDPKYLIRIAEENAKEKAGFHWPPPFSKLQSEGFLLVYKFTPTWLRVADFSELGGGSSKPGTSLFHQIIP